MAAVTHVDLSHVITAGMVTYPGLPTPIIDDHLSRDAAEQLYGPGITFQIGRVTMCTYLDVPFHRYADGHDLTGLAIERVAAVVTAVPPKIEGAGTFTVRAYATVPR
jgi:arylformamidase